MQTLSKDIDVIIYDLGLSEGGQKQLNDLARKRKAMVRQFDKEAHANKSTNSAFLVPDLVETCCYKAIILSGAWKVFFLPQAKLCC